MLHAARWKCRTQKIERDGRPASVQRRKVWLTPTTRMLCSNAAKTRIQLKLAGMPQTNEPISAAGWPKFTTLLGHAEEILLLNKFFSIVDMCLSCKDIARQICPMVGLRRWRIFGEFLAIFAYCIFREPPAARFRPAS